MSNFSTQVKLDYEAFSDVGNQRITEMSKGRLRPFFREEPMLNEDRSKAEGRPIFDMVEFVRIQSPGERDNIPDRPVNAWDKQRFAPEYEHWRKTRQNRSDGTPLEAVPLLVSKGQVEELRFFHITTLEDLANLSDAAALKFRGIQDLKQKAKDYLETQKSAAPMEKLRTELASRDDLLKQMKEQMEQQAREIEKLKNTRR